MSYQLFLKQAQQLLKEQPNLTAKLSNLSAFLNEVISDINWVGFYLYDSNLKMLTVGPFQGKVACSQIALGNGVCGTAFVLEKTIVVADVNTFENHIACDANSKSEVVIPIKVATKIIGVLDIDSPSYNRFDEALVNFLESIVSLLINSIE